MWLSPAEQPGTGHSFNATDDEDTSDIRRDNKGLKHEGLAVGEVDSRRYRFDLLARTGCVIVHDVTDPAAPAFVQYVNNRSIDGQGDFAPEEAVFILRSQSRVPFPFITVANDVSGTTMLYAIMTPRRPTAGSQPADD